MLNRGGTRWKLRRHNLLTYCYLRVRRYRPLVTACNSTNRNLEVADGYDFFSHCHCGWYGEVLGMKAKKHWVEAWSDKAPVGKGIAGSCDGDTAQAG